MALTKNFIKIFGFIIILLFVPIVSWAAACGGSSPNWTINTSDASSTDVQNCINNADSGDTITFNAGTGTWAGNIVMTTKVVNLTGAGVDATTINVTYNGSGSGTTTTRFGIWISVTAQDPKPSFRMTGFTFNFTGDNDGIAYISSDTNDDSTNFIFDNLKLTTNGELMFHRSGLANGVMYNCTIAGKLGFDGVPGLWTSNDVDAAYEFGNDSVFVFEDNDIIGYEPGRGAISYQSGNGASRYLFRYNDISLIETGEYVSPIWDQHKNSFGAEIYGNDITDPGGNLGKTSGQRGGKWLMFYNKVTSGSGAGIEIRMESNDDDTQPYNGQFQRPAESYYWSNYKNDVLEDAYISEVYYQSDISRNVPIENQDFWNYNTTESGSSQTSGIRCGPDRTVVTTCDEGTGFWETIQSCSSLTGMVGKNPSTPISGTLYKCGSSNNWVKYFTPYPYPHPLRRGDTIPPPLSAPTNVRIIPD